MLKYIFFWIFFTKKKMQPCLRQGKWHLRVALIVPSQHSAGSIFFVFVVFVHFFSSCRLCKYITSKPNIQSKIKANIFRKARCVITKNHVRAQQQSAKKNRKTTASKYFYKPPHSRYYVNFFPQKNKKKVAGCSAFHNTHSLAAVKKVFKKK